eukprot:TRINITY_DN18619_c0_g3_i1.p1 TRINITY_DN18619_c0_g3~~TRINITY_DN18619_c0_g3_i1.p1  ORF type:complete len:109 (+),score=12.82 TRINITY_DN18619_c0_g3_i1:78-404(+)
MELFVQLDVSGDGMISREEIAEVPLDVLPDALFNGSSNSSLHSMTDLFQILDVDGSGELSQEEFVEGLLNIFLHEVPVTTVQTLRLLRLANNKIQQVVDFQTQVTDKL